MILIDTSVWIPFFKDNSNHAGLFVEDLLLQREKVCINAVIEMEILQGIRDDHVFKSIKSYLLDFQYFPELSKQHWSTASDIYRSCRKQGVTIRRSLDCLIAANAMINNLTVAHIDRDFELIKKVFPALATINVRS